MVLARVHGKECGVFAHFIGQLRAAAQPNNGLVANASCPVLHWLLRPCHSPVPQGIFTVSTNAPAATAAVVPAKPAKSKKLLIIGAVVLLLVVAGAAAAWLLTNRQPQDDQDGEHASASAAKPVVVPTFLPMDTMVVNLADPGGERFAQIGISLELTDSKTADTLKQFMPSIRSSILLLVSQRTSDELLQLEGKEQLARDILGEVSRPLGFKAPGKAAPARRARSEADDGGQDGDDADSDAPRRKQAANPVRKVHFASFIIQ